MCFDVSLCVCFSPYYSKMRKVVKKQVYVCVCVCVCVQYIRVSSETSAEVLYQLMTECWKLNPPNLLISVTGGAKNFYMKTHLKDKFRRGLIKVAQTTGTH